jgi:dTDP-4-amino-4,6-dideoxygalactose transaminase
VAYEKYPRTPAGLPVSESLPHRILCLPMHPYLSEADQDLVIAAIREFAGKNQAAA